MPQPSPAPPIDYGHGKPTRKTSRLALVSFLLALPLWAVVAATIAYWRAQPPPLSGFAGVGWFFGMLGLVGVLVYSTLLLGPLSLGLGIAGLWAVRSRPESLRGRWLARLGISLSLGACLLVAAGAYRFNQWKKATQRAAVAAAALAPPQYPAEIREVEQLVRDSQVYAQTHDGHFPEDIQSLHGLKNPKDYSLWAYLDRFAYFGDGLTSDESDPARQAENESMVLIVRRQPLPGTQWVVGLNGNAFRATAAVVSDIELTSLCARTNHIRARRGLPRIDFDGPLGRQTGLPETCPSSQPATPQL